jgi:hypothetical protein
VSLLYTPRVRPATPSSYWYKPVGTGGRVDFDRKAFIPIETPAAKRPRLAGTAHRPGWPKQVHALRALFKALHETAPVDKGGSERASLEAIDNVDRLDPKARHLYRLALAELLKLSRR